MGRRKRHGSGKEFLLILKLFIYMGSGLYFALRWIFGLIEKSDLRQEKHEEISENDKTFTRVPKIKLSRSTIPNTLESENLNTKREVLGYINSKGYGIVLNNLNCNFSNINISKEVWWFNVPVNKFSKDVHLILNAVERIILIKLPLGFVIDLDEVFRVRIGINAVDLEISAASNDEYLQDVKSGGTHFNFTPYIVKEFILKL